MQKVCIVGDGLTGLTAALALSISGNYHVDLISKKKAGINTIDKRTTAISSSNFNFLSNLILKEDKKILSRAGKSNYITTKVKVMKIL